MYRTFTRQICSVAMLLAASASAHAAFHLWVINQLYSNADGTVQFVELITSAPAQQFVSGHSMTSTQGSTTHTLNVSTNLPGDTADKTFLIGTQGFAALHVVTPDYVVPNGFLFTNGGTLNWAGFDSVTYTALPTDGRMSIDRFGNPGVNSPKNFAGATGSISPVASTAFSLDNPQPGSFQSGIGLISGFSCQGPTIAVTVDGGPMLAAPYGSSRNDTAGPCGAGNTNTGFGLLINYNLFGSGAHTARLYVNSAQQGGAVAFTVVAPGGEFLSGLSKQVTVPDFPSTGKSTVLIWQESQQNFAIKSVSP